MRWMWDCISSCLVLKGDSGEASFLVWEEKLLVWDELTADKFVPYQLIKMTKWLKLDGTRSSGLTSLLKQSYTTAHCTELFQSVLKIKHKFLLVLYWSQCKMNTFPFHDKKKTPQLHAENILSALMLHHNILNIFEPTWCHVLGHLSLLYLPSSLSKLF